MSGESSLNLASLAARIDWTFWKAAATSTEVEQICRLAAQQKIRAVGLSGSRVELAYTRLEESGVKTVGLVDFPLGAADSDSKRFQAESAIDLGAQEIEIVLNLGQIKEGNTKAVLRELRDVAEVLDERPLCAVLETSFLSNEEIVTVCQLVTDSGANCISAATGFWPGSLPNAQLVRAMREAVGPRFAVKAMIGSADGQLAQSLFDAGATRLGIPMG